MDYERLVKNHLEKYKLESLKISEKGPFKSRNGQPMLLDHILPLDRARENILISKDDYKIENNVFEFTKIKHPPIKLQAYWYHLNSSQILCISYFYDFMKNKEKLNELIKYLGIENEEALYGELEVTKSSDELLTDGTNVDFAIFLKSGKRVYFEIKYTEREFGPAFSTSNTEKYNELSLKYDKIRAKHHPLVMTKESKDYYESYQFIRNAYLSCKDKGENYVVFLIPKKNAPINESFIKGSNAILNKDSFHFTLLHWETLLSHPVFKNDKVFEKYFSL